MHNFNVVFRNNPAFQVVAFTAFQIPNIEGRMYPPELAGPMYAGGIPIFSESQLPELIRRFSADDVVFAYSDVSHLEVMHRASLVNALGADFRLLGAGSATISSSKPVVSVCAVRTGCGKSQTSRCIADILRRRGKSVGVVRHAMPYASDLNRQRCQRFVTLDNLDRHQCTIEEREEYESHIRLGHVVYAGVDGLRQFGNLKAVYLDEHGPNIVFNRSIDPLEVIAFINDNFDLDRKTGGFVSIKKRLETPNTLEVAHAIL